jgi:hypothetical protein
VRFLSWPENEFVRELAKAQIPALSPKLAAIDRKASASIPGHASRQAMDLAPLCTIRPRVCHHVSHFNPEKIENDNIHMKTQACIWSRDVITIAGRASIGKHAIHDVLRGAVTGAAWAIIERRPMNAGKSLRMDVSAVRASLVWLAAALKCAGR